MMLLIDMDAKIAPGRRVVIDFPHLRDSYSRCIHCRRVIWGEDAKLERRLDLLERVSCWPSCDAVCPADVVASYPARMLL